MQDLYVVAHCVSHIGHLAAAQLEPPPPLHHFPLVRLHLQLIVHPESYQLLYRGNTRVLD